MEYEIIWSVKAKKSLKSIFNYIAADDFGAAEKVLEGIQDLVNNLYFMPDRGALIHELEQLDICDYKMLFYKHWKILYQTNHKDKQVLISLVVDSNRDFNNIVLTEIKNG